MTKRTTQKRTDVASGHLGSSADINPRSDQLALGSYWQTSCDNVQLPHPTFFVRPQHPKPSKVFETYWLFAKRRQDIFFERIYAHQNLSRPHDPILGRYRFTNVYRSSDRVSQYLIRHVQYDRDWSAEDIVFRTLIFKFFNKIETWEALRRSVGEITWANYSFEAYDRCLTDLMTAGSTIYSAAYIMSSGGEKFGYDKKHRNHLKVIEGLLGDDGASRLVECKTLSGLFEALRQHPCIGDFLGYQLSIDLNYSRVVNFSEDDFVKPGPGALDGISKCFVDLGDYSPSDIIRYMVDAQEHAFRLYDLEFRTLWGRKLHLIDCQNIFCEISKYARVAHPEIAGISGRNRIKQSYRPDTRPLEHPWFPPKWGLNNRM